MSSEDTVLYMTLGNGDESTKAGANHEKLHDNTTQVL